MLIISPSVHFPRRLPMMRRFRGWFGVRSGGEGSSNRFTKNFNSSSVGQIVTKHVKSLSVIFPKMSGSLPSTGRCRQVKYLQPELLCKIVNLLRSKLLPSKWKPATLRIWSFRCPSGWSTAKGVSKSPPPGLFTIWMIFKYFRAPTASMQAVLSASQFRVLQMLRSIMRRGASTMNCKMIERERGKPVHRKIWRFWKGGPCPLTILASDLTGAMRGHPWKFITSTARRVRFDMVLTM